MALRYADVFRFRPPPDRGRPRSCSRVSIAGVVARGAGAASAATNAHNAPCPSAGNASNDRATDIARGIGGVAKVVRVFEDISEEELKRLSQPPLGR